MSNQGLIKLTRHGRSRGRGWWLPHLWQQLGALRLQHPRGGGLAHSGGVPAGGLDPTLPPAESRQVFPGLRSWRQDGETHPALRTQGPELREKKRRFLSLAAYMARRGLAAASRGDRNRHKSPPNDLQIVCAESPPKLCHSSARWASQGA